MSKAMAGLPGSKSPARSELCHRISPLLSVRILDKSVDRRRTVNRPRSTEWSVRLRERGLQSGATTVSTEVWRAPSGFTDPMRLPLHATNQRFRARKALLRAFP